MTLHRLTAQGFAELIKTRGDALLLEGVESSGTRELRPPQVGSCRWLYGQEITPTAARAILGRMPILSWSEDHPADVEHAEKLQAVMDPLFSIGLLFLFTHPLTFSNNIFAGSRQRMYIRPTGSPIAAILSVVIPAERSRERARDVPVRYAIFPCLRGSYRLQTCPEWHRWRKLGMCRPGR